MVVVSELADVQANENYQLTARTPLRKRTNIRAEATDTWRGEEEGRADGENQDVIAPGPREERAARATRRISLSISRAKRPGRPG